VIGYAWCKDVCIPQTNTATIFKALGGGGRGKKERKKGDKTPVKELLCVTGQHSHMDRMNRTLGVQLVLAIIMKTFFRSK
jgi:hypothetical protein